MVCHNIVSSNKSVPSYAQNWNRHRANDCVAVSPQVTAIRAAPGNQQVRLRLLCSLAQHLGHVTTAYKYVCRDAYVFLELCDMLRSVADKRLFQLSIDVAATRPPQLHPRSDVSKR